MIVIIDGDQVPQLQMASHTGSFRSHTLLSTAVTEEGISVVVDQLVSRFVELCSGMRLSNGQTYCVAETLSKRTSGDLDAWCIVRFRMTWGDAVYCLRSD